MLTTELRTAILELAAKKVSARKIARSLKVSRQTVREVIRSGRREARQADRPEKILPHQQEIRDLHRTCEGNLIRVHEELAASGIAISYPALTAFCRRHGIGTTPPEPVGRYHFEPGQEMQHDTSPHTIELAGRKRKVQTASAVLCHSRMLFFQCYPTFQRFDCKVFLTEAIRHFAGATEIVMIDNTHVVVLRGTGRDMVPVPEMAAFGERYGFEFRAHALGNANRSARVERPFWFIERNFFVGRRFADWDDLNTQARQWCDKVNGSYKRHLHAVPRELWAAERPRLRPLPLWCPEPYRIHHRIVDAEGYVCVNTNRYSAPVDWIGRRVEVRETPKRVEIDLGRGKSVSHERVVDPLGRRITIAEHRPRRGERPPARSASPERQAIEREAPELIDWLGLLEKRGKGSPTLARRQLLRLVRDYPRADLVAVLSEAANYGLYDLGRIERMVLRQIAREYFRLAPNSEGDGDD